MSGTYGIPQLYVGGKEVTNFISVSVSEKGGSSINSLKVSIADPEMDENRLYNKEVIFYLNAGERDSIPYFRGFIRQVNPSTNNLSITALDPRTFLTGKESTPISITDDNNYDGYTLVQFIHDYVSTKININKTLIGLDMLNETDPSVILKGLRTDNQVPYGIITSKLPKATSDISNISTFAVKMIDDGTKSNIVIIQEPDLSTTIGPSSFSFYDGIASMSYKSRPTTQFFNIITEGKKTIDYKRGNMALGPFGEKLSGKFKDTEEAIQAAVIQSEVDDRQMTQVSLEITKHYYIGLGAVIRLNVDESELRTLHRVKSKTVSWSKSGYKCKIILNRADPIIKDYVQAF